MAPCRPKLKTDRAVEFYLSRFAEGEWREVVRPWLEGSRGALRRSLVVVPTRGQAQALKQRCLEENVPLLGVEFLTPSLARKKRAAAGSIGRSLQLLVLRDQIETRRQSVGTDDPARGIWDSLASDLEAAFADFEDLIRGGFRPRHFPRPELQEAFGAMADWLAKHGYVLGPVQDEGEALTAPPAGAPPVADRLLVLAGGPENWPEFFGLLALCRRAPALSVVLAEPEFRGLAGSAEEWVEVWQTALGCEPMVVAEEEPPAGGGAVADLWGGDGGSADGAEVMVGASRSDEMALVADALERLLGSGAGNIAVVFPAAGAAHARLVALLEERGIAYADLIGLAGTPPIDTRIQLALVDFFERGCRLEELLALWPMLAALNLARCSPGEARRAAERLYDEVQSHLLEPHLGRLDAAGTPGAGELARVARLFLPAWPSALTVGGALARFEHARDQLGLLEPAGWSALREFASRAAAPMPTLAILEAIRSFLPEKGPTERMGGRSVFARVTLTTPRRAAGVAWSDCIFTEANRSVWPAKREPSGWLGDEARRELDRAEGRFSLGLPTSEDRSALERRLYRAIARDTQGRVAFSAALFHEEDPEVRLDPNVWLERVLWSQGLLPDQPGQVGAFETLAAARLARHRGPLHPTILEWAQTWERRRDPGAPFDEFFLGAPGEDLRPHRLSASQIQDGVRDPATLWFGAVLRARRVEWRPFARALRKTVGETVHRLLAAALRGEPAEGRFTILAAPAAAVAALEAGLVRLRARWPDDRYWDSFHLDVSRAARVLLDRVFELPPSGFSAVEERMPDGATVPAGRAGRVEVDGRMDLVLSDRPRWSGAQVEIVDFKTGKDEGVSANRMASSGASLQLGVYLEAARSVGASGAVWMLRPEERPTRLGMDELERACARLESIGLHLATGLYGALTADRTGFSHAFEWPLACAPIPAAILEAKFAATFGPEEAARAEEEDDEDV